MKPLTPDLSEVARPPAAAGERPGADDERGLGQQLPRHHSSPVSSQLTGLIPGKVAVIIVNHNGGDLLPRCLRALARQTLAPHRVYVVDNASGDGSVESILGEFPTVSLMKLDKNTGFAAANNLAAKRAEGCDWIAVLNPDAFPEPAWLEALMHAAARRPEFSFFGSRMLMADDPTRLDGVGDAYHISGLIWREGHGAIASGKFLEEREIFSPCAAAALYRYDAFLEAGGFDEDYHCYVEDVDLGFRLRLQGHRCAYVPDAVVLHKGSALTGRRSSFSTYHGHRNLTWTFVKNMPAPWLVLFAPFHILACVLCLFWIARRGNGRAIWRAKVDAVKGLRGTWAKRRAIQAARTVGFGKLLPLMRFGVRRR